MERSDIVQRDHSDTTIILKQYFSMKRYLSNTFLIEEYFKITFLSKMLKFDVNSAESAKHSMHNKIISETNKFLQITS